MADNPSPDNLPTVVHVPPAEGTGCLPRQIGKYPIERQLGRGGMGVVYLGRHPELEVPVAIKVLPAELGVRDPTYAERFVLEARTAARISHPNVVRVFDAGADPEGGRYLVMEYVPGGSARELVNRHGPLAPGQAVGIVTGVGQALEAAARYGIVHRDIKPENILLGEDGTPRLADLGLAKGLQSGLDSDLTTTGVAMGTPHYMAPEQARNAKSADARADIYSLGATFYHLLTGRPPFEDESAMGVLLKHVSEPFPDPRELRPEIPEPIANVLLKMTRKEPADRYPDATALLADLRALPTAALPASRRRWRPAAVVGALMLLLAALVAGIFAIGRGRQAAGSPAPAAAVPAVRPADDLAQLDDAFTGEGVSTSWRRLSEQEGWAWNPLESVDVGRPRDGWLSMVPRTTAWYGDYRGVLLFRQVDGDFVATARVEVTNRAGNGPPDADFSVAGLMVRVPRDIRPATWSRGGENALMVALGTERSGNYLNLEAKTTVGSASDVQLTPVNQLPAEVRLVRLGGSFVLMGRQGTGQWHVLARRYLPRFPDRVQVGLCAGTDWSGVDAAGLDGYNRAGAPEGSPGLRAQFDYFVIRRLEVPPGWPGDGSIADPGAVTDDRIVEWFGGAFGTP